MATATNPFASTDPYPVAGGFGQLGTSLGKALFGDPDARAKMQEAQARVEAYRQQAAESQAHAGLYSSQTTGSDAENTANSGLPQVFANMYTPPPQPQVAPSVEPQPTAAPAADPIVVNGLDPHTAETFRNHVPGLLAAMVQGGHAKEASGLLQAMAAFAGPDETARRGQIADGHTPGAEFATTPQRADDIAANAADAKYREGTAVAGINHANDVPVAVANHAQDPRVAAINHASDIPVAYIRGNTDITDEHIKAGDNGLADMIGSMYPGTRINSANRTPAQQQQLIAEGATSAVHSYHVPGNGGQAVDIPAIPGKTLASVVSDLQANGATVLEAKDETALGQGTGPHWHIAIANPSTKGGSKAPKEVSAASMKMLDTEISNRFPAGTISDQARVMLRTNAATNMQDTGNPIGAVDAAVRSQQATGKAKRGAFNAVTAPGQSSSEYQEGHILYGPGGKRVQLHNNQWVPIQ